MSLMAEPKVIFYMMNPSKEEDGGLTRLPPLSLMDLTLETERSSGINSLVYGKR